MLKGKKIVLGVSGSIAAYKSIFLLRLLQKEGAEVKVIMTPSATEFIKPISFSAFTKDAVEYQFVGAFNNWNDHVNLGLWADLILIAPATAQTIAKIANGFCDNLLTAVVLSAKSPVSVAPAMDRDMWLNPAVKNNLKLLTNHGIRVLPVEKGELASGLEGEGRMSEPENIIKWLYGFFAETSGKSILKGKQILITAGPTREPLDPVRYISNHSSGKMGYAIAEAFATKGANVHLISGPVDLNISHPNIKIYPVETAVEMHEKAMQLYPKTDVAVMAAAVSDYSPENYSDLKIKKTQAKTVIQLKKNPDILAAIGKLKTAKQLNIGFALETDNEIKNAKQKLASKNADLIVLNSLKDEGAGFKSDTNKVSVIDKDNNITDFELKSKKLLAIDLVRIIEEKFADLQRKKK